MRKDINAEFLRPKDDLKVNKSEIARRFNCSWKTVDRKFNPEKYAKPKKDIDKE